MSGFNTEDEAFSYAYNQGHADNRKKEAYKPNPNTRDASDFKKIYKQRAEASDSYDNLAHQDEMAQEAYQEYVQELDPATDYPPMSFEEWYEQTMAIYDTPEYDKYLEQQYLQMQEDEEELARQLMTLEADWRDLSRDSSGRWMKQDIQSDSLMSRVKTALKEGGYGDVVQVTHLEKRIPETNNHKYYFVCITKNNNKMYAVGAYGRYSFRSSTKQPYVKLYNLFDKEPNGKTPISLTKAEIYTRRKIEALSQNFWYYADTPTPDEEPENLDAYIDIQPAQSGTFPLPVKEQKTFSQSGITLRELSETMNALTGNLLGFDMSYRTVVDMLGSQDNPERREALLSTMEETIMTLEFYEETGYDGDIQMMVDIMRQNGMNPPPQFEEEVLARYQFEDKWAAEDKKILKPEVPADFNMKATFGNNMVLMAEGLEKDRDSALYEVWELKHLDCLHMWLDEDLEVGVNGEYEITAYCPKCDATLHLIVDYSPKDGITLPGRRLREDFYDNSPLMAFAEEEDEGPTIEEFFRDISKVLNKYGEFTWDSEAEEEGLYFSGMLFPSNGAYNFFQYDEDFSE